MGEHVNSLKVGQSYNLANFHVNPPKSPEAGFFYHPYWQTTATPPPDEDNVTIISIPQLNECNACLQCSARVDTFTEMHREEGWRTLCSGLGWPSMAQRRTHERLRMCSWLSPQTSFKRRHAIAALVFLSITISYMFLL